MLIALLRSQEFTIQILWHFSSRVRYKAMNKSASTKASPIIYESFLSLFCAVMLKTVSLPPRLLNTYGSAPSYIILSYVEMNLFCGSHPQLLQNSRYFDGGLKKCIQETFGVSLFLVLPCQIIEEFYKSVLSVAASLPAFSQGEHKTYILPQLQPFGFY